MFTYTRTDDGTNDNVAFSELHLYGSSRLGYIQDLIQDISTATLPTDGYSTRILGLKRYELTNHLGNVLTVITDRRFGTQQGTTGMIKYYEADVVQANDYYPFGLMMLGRSWSDGYRFGFNGKENTNEVYGNGNAVDFGARMYDARLGRWLSIDPLEAKYPALSPYHFGYNSPVTFKDVDGRDNVIYLVVLNSAKAYLTTAEINDIVKQANLNFEALGVKTQVVLATDVVGDNVYAFDPNNTGIDATDAIAVLGSSTDVVNYIKNYDVDFGAKVEDDQDWGPKGDYNPAITENALGSSPNIDKGGLWIAVDAAELKKWGGQMDESVVKATGLLINHEAGHSAGLDHFGDKKGSDAYKNSGYTDSHIMRNGESLAAAVSGRGYSFVTSNSTVEYKSQRGIRTMQNQDYRTALRGRFGDNEYKVNYDK